MSMTESERISISGLLDVLNTGISLSTCHIEYSIQVDVLEDLACCIKELEQYRAIGTVSEFRELKEKATAKKPYYVQYDVKPEIGNYHCPTCEGFVLYTHPICSCGQKLDWSEGKE